MEVHHHSHGHGKKNWKSYIWEFTMLFLAVFCGSVAEYFLEHKIESDREKQYIISLVSDLKTDTANIALTISDFNSANQYFDTIDTHINQITDKYNPNLMHSLKRILGYRDFISTDKTLQQLKNAGNLRLIKKQYIADSIAVYDFQVKKFQITSGELQSQFNKAFDDYQALIYDNTKDTVGNDNNYLISTDKAAFKKYHNHIKIYKLLRKLYVMRLQELKTKVENLLVVLKDEYHIE
ncbi:MAG: hypothetical protein ACOVO1_06240 [Chitinophagaceae bacterium]